MPPAGGFTPPDPRGIYSAKMKVEKNGSFLWDVYVAIDPQAPHLPGGCGRVGRITRQSGRETDMSETGAARRQRGGGGATRRAERTAVSFETARFIQRNIPNFEILNEEALQIIEWNAETILAEIGVNFIENPAALILKFANNNFQFINKQMNNGQVLLSFVTQTVDFFDIPVQLLLQPNAKTMYLNYLVPHPSIVKLVYQALKFIVDY